ncbi:MAG: thymidine kinase [Clostridia bacterium]|nr:thymidine kinase [Clostridia bacterium]
MNKLYFRYGAMGSSKTAQALMLKFNYEQKGHTVFLFKPVVDKRCEENGKAYVASRIGLKAECIEFSSQDDFWQLSQEYAILNVKTVSKNVIIIDECQFLTAKQVEQLKEISLYLPVLCFGLLTNYKTELFEGSKRLIELADSIAEVKSVCKCGRKATINVRLSKGLIVTQGNEIEIGGDDKYEGMCYYCYKKKLLSQQKKYNK